MTVQDKIFQLRGKMAQSGIDTYIVTKFDPHLSEYSEDYYSRSVCYLSGFTGSAGVLVVSKGFAGLWTDGRYETQGAHQLADTGIDLFIYPGLAPVDYMEYAIKVTPQNGILGFDPRTLPIDKIGAHLTQMVHKGIQLQTDYDLLGEIWPDRPALSSKIVFEHPLAYAGLNRDEKINRIREKIKQHDLDCVLISSLDDIAWLYNLRGQDVDFNPLFSAFTIIDRQLAHLFINIEKIKHLKEKIEKNGVLIHPYGDILPFLHSMDNETRIGYASAKTCFAFMEPLSKLKAVALTQDYTTSLKAIKNKVEIKNIMEANVKFGVSLVRLFIWLEENKGNAIREWDVSLKLDELCRQDPLYKGFSFSVIAGYMANAAIIHYAPTKEKSATLKAEGLLLIDSGAQYENGTTDVTRTVPLGEITREMKRHYTLVLKGHINLAQTTFLQGTTGVQLDVIARKPLWDHGLNYHHGTGHGIGYYLCVHEGPQSISQKVSPVPLAAGMVISNEPGVYFPGQYGIRLENSVLVENAPFADFLRFQTISYVPFHRRCIDVDLLTDMEVQWLNGYHQEVYSKLEGHLNSNEAQWLRERTLPL